MPRTWTPDEFAAPTMTPDQFAGVGPEEPLLKRLGKKARVIGTGALKAIGDTGDFIAWTFGPPPIVMPGEKRETLEEYRARIGTKEGPGLTHKLAALGLPTAPRAEAARLGTSFDPATKALTTATEFGTGALLGGSLRSAVRMGLGAAGGEAAGSMVGLPETGKIVGSVAGVLTKKAPPSAQPVIPKPPEIDQLFASGDATFNAVRQSGAAIANPHVQNTVIAMEAKIRLKGARPSLNREAFSALREIKNDAGLLKSPGLPVWDMTEIMATRDLLKNAAKSSSGETRLFAKDLVDAWDDMAAKVQPQHVIAGDPQAAARLLRQARFDWSRAKKAELVHSMTRDALELRPVGQSADVAVRQTFRQLARNKSKMRTFTPAEREEIRGFVDGGNVQNFISWIGKFAPTSAVGLSLHGGAGYFGGLALGGPLMGAAGLPGATWAARGISAATIKRNARLLEEFMRRGGPPPSTPPSRFPSPLPIPQVGGRLLPPALYGAIQAR